MGLHSFFIYSIFAVFNAGVSLEALCNTSAPPPDAVLLLCLKSLYALLAPTTATSSAGAAPNVSEESARSGDSTQSSIAPKTKHTTSWAARVLVEERVLCVELVHVLYRVLLARDSAALHLLALETLVFLLRALRQQIREQRDAQTKPGDGNFVLQYLHVFYML